MSIEISDGPYYALETADGETTFVPCEDVAGEDLASLEGLQNYCDGELIRWGVHKGILARWTLSRYLDCAPWDEFPNEDEAIAYFYDWAKEGEE